MEDYSVIQARDPSITGWARPKAGISLVKNLRSIFEAEESGCSASKQPLKVYLRLKPFLSPDGVLSPTNFNILDERTLSTFAPPDSVTHKNQGSSVTHQFKFTKIFGPATCQKEVFDECVSESVQDFVIGSNSLLFTYGTTNAGKTFTVQGTGSQPGLVPRALDLLFKRISGKEALVGRYKPEKVDGITELDDFSIEEDAKYKEFILQYDWERHTNITRDGEDKCSSTSSDFVSNAFRGMQKTILEESPTYEEHKERDVVFSVWVSYAEIYNDYIYDLLDIVQGGGARRIPLKLAMDCNGNTYIKDLRHIHVTSGDEAFQVMLYGKEHLQVSATKMNTCSSRSHSVFTVKLVRYVNTEESPTHARVSNLTFCDLAGAERVKKTLNIGDRLKESSNINTSLHVLGRCLTTIKENQTAKYKKQVPFRESKLTRLFQRALLGQESLAMIVNLNPSSILYDESIHVLKFSAIANQIVLQTPIKRARRTEKKKSRFSSLALRPSKSICWENPSDEELESVGNSAVNDVVAQNEALKDKLAKVYEELCEEKKKSLAIERDIRRSLTSEFMKMLEKSDKTWRERLRAEDARREEVFNERLIIMEEYYQEYPKKPKRMSQDVGNTSRELVEFEAAEMRESFEDAKETIKDLETALDLEKRNAETLRAELKEVRQARDSLLAQNSQLRFSVANAEDNEQLLQASTRDKIVEELQKLLAEERESSAAKTKQVEAMKLLLNEARDDVLILSKEKEEAEEEVDRLDQELAEKKEEVLDLTTKMEHLEALVAELTETVTSFEKKEMEAPSKNAGLDSILEEKRALEAKLKEEQDIHVEKSKLYENQKARVEELEEKMKACSVDERNGLNDKIAGLEEEKEALRVEISTFEKKASMVEELTQKMYCLEAEKEDLKDAIRKMQQGEKNHEVEALREERQQLLQKISSIQEAHEEMGCEVKGFTEENQLLLKISSMEKACEEKGEEVESLKEEHQQLLKKISSMEKALDGSGQEVEALKEERRRLQEKINSMEEAHDRSGHEVESLKEERRQLQKKISSMEKALDGSGREVDALKEERRQLQEKMSSMLGAHEEKGHVVEALKEERRQLQEKISSMLEAHEEKGHVVEALKEERCQLLEKISSAQAVQDSVKMSKEKEMKKLQDLVKEFEDREKESLRRLAELEEWKLQQKEAMVNQMEEAERKHEAEIKALQKDVKNSLQKNRVLEETMRKLEEDKRQLEEKSQEETSKLEREMKALLQKSQSQQAQVPDDTRTLAELLKMLNKCREDLDKCKLELQDAFHEKLRLQHALEESEKKFASFKTNRDVILQRSEKSLQEAKEDSERAKKEVIALTETLYKNPSTPNQKHYESEIYRLKQQVDTLADQLRASREQNDVLKEKKDVNVSQTSVRLGMSEDFAEPKKRAIVKKSTAKSVKGSAEDISLVPPEDPEPPKSARRTRRKDTTESDDSCMLPPSTPSAEESSQPRRTNRNRRLYVPPTADNFNGENMEPLVIPAEATTPDVLVKNLRSRSRRM